MEFMFLKQFLPFTTFDITTEVITNKKPVQPLFQKVNKRFQCCQTIGYNELANSKPSFKALREKPCEFQTSTFDLLFNHIVAEHFPYSKLSKCSQCQKIYIGLQERETHFNSECPFKLPFSCAVCTKKFGTYGQLKKHCVVLHEGDGSGFRCFKCGEIFECKVMVLAVAYESTFLRFVSLHYRPA